MKVKKATQAEVVRVLEAQIHAINYELRQNKSKISALAIRNGALKRLRAPLQTLLHEFKTKDN